MHSGWKMNLERILVATKPFSPLDDYSSLLSGHLKVLSPCVGLISVPPKFLPIQNLYIWPCLELGSLQLR